MLATGIIAFGQKPDENGEPHSKAEQAQPQSQSSPTPAEQGQPSQQPAAGAASAEDVFAALDTNHDGKLNQEEFSKLFRNAKEADVAEEFTRWDKNGDKVVTIEEFKIVYPTQQK